MQIISFRIKNFRSIVDTGWCRLSSDGVTILVGQNESGKSSILEALSKTFSSEELSADDIRNHTVLPEVFYKIAVDKSELIDELSEYNTLQVERLGHYLDSNENILTSRFYWKKTPKLSVEFTGFHEILDEDDGLKNAIEPNEEVDDESSESVSSIATPSEFSDSSLTLDEISSAVFNLAPYMTLFQAQSGLLPNLVDINSEHKLLGDGNVAARNFLNVAGINVKELIASDLRSRGAILKRANDKITKDFATFWSQTIGQTSKLQLECELETYGSDTPGKVGTPYFVFWISDGLNKLYPKQRSLGVRWFISFYLQLRASEISSNKRIFLLDEPGANLHSKAQADVLRLINKLSKDISIIYSTHSPHMIEYDKLYRVFAVQRKNEDQEDSPTELIDAHKLGAASSDTLSPILTAMGVDLSHQQVVKKSGNVLLEEMSGFYYLTAFWELTKEKKVAHFIAATGVGKVPTLANMFRGWGLNFIVAVDDDSHGRQVFNSMKKELFGDDEVEAKSNMVKLPGCTGIEDVFSVRDFNKYVLDNEAAETTHPISTYVGKVGLSKPVLSYQFLLSVRSGKVNWKSLEAETKDKIKAVVSSISTLLP